MDQDQSVKMPSGWAKSEKNHGLESFGTRTPPSRCRAAGLKVRKTIKFSFTWKVWGRLSTLLLVGAEVTRIGGANG